MTATSAMLQNKSAATTFDLIREKMGIMLNAIYTDYIIPQISKEIKKGDLVQIVPTKEDNERTAEAMSAQTGADKKEILAQLTKQKTQEIKVAADYFKNTKYTVDVYVTSEEFDKSTLLSSMNDMILTYSQVAPGLLNVEKLIVDTLDLLGLDGQEYINTQANGQNNQGQGETTGQGQSNQGQQASQAAPSKGV